MLEPDLRAKRSEQEREPGSDRKAERSLAPIEKREKRAGGIGRRSSKEGRFLSFSGDHGLDFWGSDDYFREMKSTFGLLVILWASTPVCSAADGKGRLAFGPLGVST